VAIQETISPLVNVFLNSFCCFGNCSALLIVLPLYTRAAAQLLLADALPGRASFGDRFDQLLKAGLSTPAGVEMLHPGTAAFEFGILT